MCLGKEIRVVRLGQRRSLVLKDFVMHMSNVHWLAQWVECHPVEPEVISSMFDCNELIRELKHRRRMTGRRRPEVLVKCCARA